MSPERLQGRPYKYPADVWAIGLVLLECALGRFPYSAALKTGVYLDMMQVIVNGPSPSLPRLPDGSFGGGWSREFVHFIACCLHKDPEQRATAEELLLHPWLSQAAQRCANNGGLRTKEQMRAWVAGIKPLVQARARAERAKAEGDFGAGAMDTSTSGFPFGTAAAAGGVGAGASASAAAAGGGNGSVSNDPFEAGYNNTTTSGGTAAGAAGGGGGQGGGRFNVPANAQSSFYTAKPI
jgi:hypothetical protein